MSGPGLPRHRYDWPVSSPKAAVLVCHGLGEHGGRYQGLADDLNARGFSVRACDQVGHGRSGGRRGILPDRDALVTDLAADFAAYARSQQVATVLLGHSMGGVVAARAVLQAGLRPAALVLSSPAFRTWTPPWLVRCAAVLSRLLPSLPLRNGLDVDGISHDSAVVAAYRADPLVHGWASPRTADFIFRAGAESVAAAPALAVPTLLLFGGQDRLVNPQGSRDFARNAPPSMLTQQEFPELFHEIFNEAEPARSMVISRLADWLERL